MAESNYLHPWASRAQRTADPLTDVVVRYSDGRVESVPREAVTIRIEPAGLVDTPTIGGAPFGLMALAPRCDWRDALPTVVCALLEEGEE